MVVSEVNTMKGIHIMAKPVGAFCNLNCTYCFYLEKQNFYTINKMETMSPPILEGFIRKYCESNHTIPQMNFVWQGGEPMLAGIDFYKDVIRLQKKYCKNKSVLNSIQTNGTYITSQWCQFFLKNDFSIGVSLDGDQLLHDIHRRDHQCNSSFLKTINGIKLLQEYNIPITAMCCVTADNADYPLEIYDFFKSIEIKNMQFSPVVERLPNTEDKKIGCIHASPSTLNRGNDNITSWSVPVGKYGSFLNTIFDQWVKKDVGHIYIQNFEWALASWLGLKSNICLFSKECGHSLIIEHNGDLYSCDHYMYPQYNIGNILDDDIKTLIEHENHLNFSCLKKQLPQKCVDCNVSFACQGECPRHRFITEPNTTDLHSYLCKDYQKFFRHIHPHMKAMAQLLNNGCSASVIMQLQKGSMLIVKKNLNSGENENEKESV